jgi:circadian clock protein KaiB
MKKSIKDSSKKQKQESDTWNLCLYVKDKAPVSLRAMNNVKRICEKYLRGRYFLEVVDLSIHPEFAKRDQIVALPTLVRKTPPGGRRVVGDFSNTNRVLNGLDLPLAR